MGIIYLYILNMTKGTTSKGKRNNISHILCKRCGKRSYHIQKKRCASCAYPHPKMRHYNWGKKAIGRRTQGTGRLSYLSTIKRREKNQFRVGVAKSQQKKK